MAKPTKEKDKVDVEIKEAPPRKKKPAPKSKEDIAEDMLGTLSGTTHKVAAWAVAAVLKEYLPEGFDPQLRALSYLPAHTAAYLSAYISLSKDIKDLDTARFEARASAKGVVLSIIDPILNPEPQPIGFRMV
jgi:hypothetical protein